MNTLRSVLSAAIEIETFCRAHGWQFCFIGGVAVQRWGMPRFTQDVDLTLMTGFGDEASYIDILLQQFEGRLQNAAQFAMERRVLLVRTKSGVSLDIALGAFPFEEGCIERASAWQLDNAALFTCGADDLVILKVFAGRDRDWGDVEGVLERQHDKLDLAHIRRELPQLLEIKEDIHSMDKLERMIALIDQRMK